MVPSPGLIRPWRTQRPEPIAEVFTPGNQVQLLRDGPEAFPAMLQAIDQAQSFIWLEMYWFDSDAIGVRFKEALLRAAKRGVAIRVLYDAVGSLGVATEFFAELRAAGRVAIYNPIALWRSRWSKLSQRNHRKLLVVDARIGFVGGINFAEAWDPGDPAIKPWRDDAVSVAGPAALELARSFRDIWQRVTKERLPLDALSPVPTAGSAEVAVLAHSLARQRRKAFRAYLGRFSDARHRIWIANAYFLPSRRMVSALRAATRRGLDVRLIVPAVSDVEIVRHASRSVWGPLLRSGARIYEWQPSILHSKTAVVDGIWATIGSFNLDARSLLYNLELNVAVLDAAFAQTVERSFESDMQRCREVAYEHFKVRPLGERVLERAAYWFRSWL